MGAAVNFGSREETCGAAIKFVAPRRIMGLEHLDAIRVMFFFFTVSR